VQLAGASENQKNKARLLLNNKDNMAAVRNTVDRLDKPSAYYQARVSANTKPVFTIAMFRRLTLLFRITIRGDTTEMTSEKRDQKHQRKRLKTL
jgi:hypothetical protein